METKREVQLARVALYSKLETVAAENDKLLEILQELYDCGVLDKPKGQRTMNAVSRAKIALGFGTKVKVAEDKKATASIPVVHYTPMRIPATHERPRGHWQLRVYE